MAINAAGTKRFSKKAKIGIATGAVAALLLTAGGLTYSLTAGSLTYVPSSDVVTVSKQDLVSKVSTTGTVAPLKEVSLYIPSHRAGYLGGREGRRPRQHQPGAREHRHLGAAKGTRLPARHPAGHSCRECQPG